MTYCVSGGALNSTHSGTHDIFGMRRWIFARLLSLAHLVTKMNWLGFEVKGFKGQGHSLTKGLLGRVIQSSMLCVPVLTVSLVVGGSYLYSA